VVQRLVDGSAQRQAQPAANWPAARVSGGWPVGGRACALVRALVGRAAIFHTR
jgi:hypothetical protein